MRSCLSEIHKFTTDKAANIFKKKLKIKLKIKNNSSFVEFIFSFLELKKKLEFFEKIFVKILKKFNKIIYNQINSLNILEKRFDRYK